VKLPYSMAIALRTALVGVAVIRPASPLESQIAVRAQPAPVNQTSDQGGSPNIQSQAEGELQQGIRLTRAGLFEEAIPHLEAARGHVFDEYAAEFDLALCHVGKGEATAAIQILVSLRRAGHDNADVNNLLAQAYIGNSQSGDAFEALNRAAALTPQNEKLYLFVADACMDRQNYALGLRIVELGLRNMPNSARLHYERGMVLALLDEFDLAKSDFELAVELAPESETGSMAAAQRDMFAGNMPGAIQVAREAIKNGRENPVLLSVLGEALIRSGATPGQAEFVEAQTALEKSLRSRPNSSSSHIALARVYILAGRLDDAIVHLEKARALDSSNPAVYANLATAYRRRGELPQAKNMLAILAEINQKQAEKIGSAPGDRKASYGGSASTAK
jgi:predicted Zn-dependent protease